MRSSAGDGGGDGLEAPLRVSRHLLIPPRELEWRFSASGGPGGQHANTSNTRVELIFDIEGSTVLGPRQRARLLARLGPAVRLTASEERSQLRNRQAARQRLAQRLADALRPERPRTPTAPTRASQERRLREKRLRSARKQERRAGEDPA
ncbi:MAG TPA: alternative ribosome rescue aminoacyl-tRNA hydrolase ArfB [Acidimicrobiales bacterium]|nr:alternative ribosome rescue aminoacyl-tRNA hydrolase ArfB [Acidimicrobiales bacterium]